MKSRHKRFAMIAGGIAALGIALALVLNAFRSNLVFFFTPSEIVANEAPLARNFRVGGMVVAGSVERQPDGVSVRFLVTDTAQSIPVVYAGILPDLFREGKGVVAQGKLGADGVFQAEQVLAKHDENYMPPEAAEAVERANKAMRDAHRSAVSGSSEQGAQRQ
ncbi:MAG: cytochrome c maturation protein CcmE [Betaproteobacteria bacterium]|jgi:cytochrome c-type biogenesis protein CcmE|nr:MAG: cytochrome c maturation protein CcmE [Betaproteobacteria bacterium]